MNVYDFDGTIYRGDSSLRFYLFCLRHRPSLLGYLPEQILGILLYKLGCQTKTEMKSHFFSFLRGIDDVLLQVERFWATEQHRIEPWYLLQQKDDDLIISASPEFLLRPICHLKGIQNLIASQVEPSTGIFLSPNCYGEEKVRQYRSRYGTSSIEAFYSDSLSDSPMAAQADKAWLVEKGKLTAWPSNLS